MTEIINIGQLKPFQVIGEVKKAKSKKVISESETTHFQKYCRGRSRFDESHSIQIIAVASALAFQHLGRG